MILVYLFYFSEHNESVMHQYRQWVEYQIKKKTVFLTCIAHIKNIYKKVVKLSMANLK